MLESPLTVGFAETGTVAQTLAPVDLWTLDRILARVLRGPAQRSATFQNLKTVCMGLNGVDGFLHEGLSRCCRRAEIMNSGIMSTGKVK